MNLQLLKEVLLVVIIVYGLYTGLSVYRSNPKNTINRVFLLLTIFSLLWITFSYLGGITKNEDIGLLFKRLNFATLVPFFSVSYVFSFYFPDSHKRNVFLELSLLILSIFLFIFVMSSSHVIREIQIENWGNNIVGGSLFYVFNLIILIFTILIFFNLISKYRRISRNEKIKVLYLLVGASVYALLNIVFNVVVPLFLNSYKYEFIGDSAVLFFIGFTAYAILKHNLFDIKVITTEIATVLISFTLFVMIFVSNNATEYVLKFVIWVLASCGGWMLIGSVKKEIKQKEELEHLTKKLEEANSHLKELDQMKDDFLGMASHELNTPLAAIEGYLSMILEEGMCGELQPQTREYLNRIFSSSQRLSAIVKDLLNVSRIESGRIHLLYAEVQIEELIKQAVAEIDPKVKEKKHTTCLELPANPLPKSWFDPTRITEVLLNLLGNAVKYTDDSGHIEIGAKQKGKDILIWVKDNGKGIPKDRADRVFAKFTQVDVLKDEVKGTGLGMYISQKFVELHKGKIWFESSGAGKGTTFFVSLPIVSKKPYDPNEGDGPILH